MSKCKNDWTEIIVLVFSSLGCHLVQPVHNYEPSHHSEVTDATVRIDELCTDNKILKEQSLNHERALAKAEKQLAELRLHIACRTPLPEGDF